MVVIGTGIEIAGLGVVVVVVVVEEEEEEEEEEEGLITGGRRTGSIRRDELENEAMNEMRSRKTTERMNNVKIRVYVQAAATTTTRDI
jgi:hypothetical protein